VAQHPKDDLGAGAAVKMENGEVKSGQQVYKGQGHAQGKKEQGMGAAQGQIKGLSSTYLSTAIFQVARLSDVYCDCRKLEGIHNGDNPELKKRGLMDKV
jgi:hypothetical protein